jgi:hypothetical protein
VSTKVISPKAVASYPHLDKPQVAEEGQTPKYSIALLFTPEMLKDPAEKARFAAMKAAVLTAAEEKWPGKSTEMLKKKQLRLPFREDWEAKDHPEGTVFCNVRSTQPPAVVYAHAGPDGKPARMPVEQIKDEVYAGAIVRASLSAFGYDKAGNRGIAFGLNNIQKLGEGDRIDGRAAAEDEFDVDLSAAPANLEDLLS